MHKLSVLIIFTMFFSATWAQDLSKASIKKYNQLPKSVVIDLQNKKKVFKSLFNNNQPTVVMFFSPDCDHCEEELEKIQQERQNMKTINFIMISNRPLSLLKPFYKKHKLSNFKNINIYSDPSNLIARYYGIGSYPSMVIYDAQHRFTKRYISSIVNALGIFRGAYPNSK